MAMWNRCAICGRAIPVGELCYGVKNWHGDPDGGDTICRDCLVPENAPTLTPPNEWVEALEAINNAAVAYIEGGPYENDLPGMELAVEIDRLSRDFVRPPNEPLTLEQLREMDGEPVWVEDVKHWALIDIEKGGQWDGIPFAVWAENGAKFTYNVKSRGLHCYRRPTEGEEDI